MPNRNLMRQMKAIQGETTMKQMDTNSEKRSVWQLIFLQSKVNGAPYYGEELPGRNWEWPKDTYLQRRLQRHRWDRPAHRAEMN
jgi:hypothetical protein